MSLVSEDSPTWLPGKNHSCGRVGLPSLFQYTCKCRVHTQMGEEPKSQHDPHLPLCHCTKGHTQVLCIYWKGYHTDWINLFLKYPENSESPTSLSRAGIITDKRLVFCSSHLISLIPNRLTVLFCPPQHSIVVMTNHAGAWGPRV